MSTLGKLVALLVISALMASSLMRVNAVSVDDMPKPSAPDFTVKIVAYPYDVPPKTTTTIDQYTGKETTTTQPGYPVENKSIAIKIKNQPLCEQNGFYFYIRMKGHYGTDWTSIDVDSDYTATFSDIYPSKGEEYTVVSCSAKYSSDSLLDFQVKAVLGHDGYESIPDHPLAMYGVFIIDASSGWSNIHTLNMMNNTETVIPDTSTPPFLAPTSSPDVTPSALPNQSPVVTSQTTSQSDSMFFFENTSIIAFGVSCIVIGFLLVALVFSRERSSAKMSWVSG